MTIQDAAEAPRTGQCSVTGKVVPEDELVTINGQLVCAEGKAILLERLKSGEGLPGELKRPTALRRFSCIFLDGLIVILPLSILVGIATASHASATIMGALSLLSVAAQVIYFGQLHGTRGQTVGKMAGKIRVINLDGTPITMRTGYVRSIAYVGIGALTTVATFMGNLDVLALTNVVVGLYGLANVLFALLDRNQQRALHDRIAGTRVVELA